MPSLPEKSGDYILQYVPGTLNSFFLSLVIIHFKHMLYNNYVDVYNLSLYEMLEKTKAKIVQSKQGSAPDSRSSSEPAEAAFCSNLYRLIKAKTQ